MKDLSDGISFSEIVFGYVSGRRWRFDGTCWSRPGRGGQVVGVDAVVMDFAASIVEESGEGPIGRQQSKSRIFVVVSMD